MRKGLASSIVLGLMATTLGLGGNAEAASSIYYGDGSSHTLTTEMQNNFSGWYALSAQNSGTNVTVTKPAKITGTYNEPYNSYATHVYNGAAVTYSADNNEINMTEANGNTYGLYAKINSSINCGTGNITIKSTSGEVMDVAAIDNSTINYSGGDITAQSDNGGAYGLFANKSSTLSYGGGKITAQSDNGSVYGVFAQHNSVISNLGSTNITVTTSNGHAAGLRTYIGSTINYSGGTIKLNNSSTGDYYARAIYTTVINSDIINITGATTININSTAKNETEGIFGYGTVNVSADMNMDVTTTNGTAMLIGPSRGGIVNIDNKSNITGTITGGSSNRVMGVGIGSRDTTSLQGTSMNQTAGTSINMNVIGYSGNVYGVYVSKYGTYTNDGTLTATVNGNGKNAYGLSVASYANYIATNDNAFMVTGSDTSVGIQVQGTALLSGNLVVSAPIALDVMGSTNADLEINKDGGSTVKITGDVVNEGDGTNVLKLNLDTADSYLTGTSKMTSFGTLDIALANSALWNVTADSTLTSLDNSGIVNMRYTGAGNYETVTTDTLSGAGTLKVNTDLQTSKDNLDVTTNSDKLVITGTSSGTHTIDVEDTSLLSGKKSEGYVLLVEDKTSGGATFVGGDVVKGGLYKYTPLIISVNPGDNPDILDTYSNVPTGNVKNWYLAGYEKTGELQPVVAPLIGAGENRYAAYRFEQDNLLLRLGELRDNENSQGIWAKVKTAKETVNDTTDSRFTMYQVGYDKKYKDDEHGKKYFGVAFNHTKGDQDYSSTSHGESSSNAMTLYNTWLGKKGHYLDLVGKVGKINTDWDYSNARFPDSGDSSAWFYNLSGEYGRKIMNKDGFYTEPQAQLTYGHINGAGYTSDSGINVDQDSINSLIGRVGFTIGKHFNGDEDDKRTNVYAKLFYNHEFLGDSDVRMNDTYGDSYTHSGDFGGSWWTAGVGVTAQLDKKTNAYFDVQKTFGGDIDQKWQFNVGLRWNWGGAKKAKAVETAAPVEEATPVAAAPMADYYMDSVHYDTDQDVIRPDQAGKVTHFAEVAKENPDHTFKLVGNTDSDASDSYNEDLSRRRVERVKNAAEQKGVPAAQIQTNYKGEKDPASSNATAQGKADNRRVDMWEHK